MADIRFGTLGAANITPNALTQPASRNADVAVVAIAARDRAHAEAMAEKEGVEHVVDDYQAVIDHPDVNVVYNPLPISHHHEWTLKALTAGKPVLCEKSFAMNEREAIEMAEAADKAGLLLIEAFHYRYHPVFLRALENLPRRVHRRVGTADRPLPRRPRGPRHAEGQHPDDLRDRRRGHHGHGLLSTVLDAPLHRRGTRGRLRRGR